MPEPKYKRVVIKLSGEMLCNGVGDPIDAVRLRSICEELKEIHSAGVETCVVVGGGNIFRGHPGRHQQGVDRTTGDFMGMLATVINGMALMDCLEKMGVVTRVQSAIPMDHLAEQFILRKAVRHLEKGRLVIFVAGTGNPYFSTDTAAALRASEIEAEIILKATKVDGIFTADPKKDPEAKRYEQLSFMDALKNRLQVMDSTAFSLCMDNHIPIMVFNSSIPGSLMRAVCGDLSFGTLVS